MKSHVARFCPQIPVGVPAGWAFRLAVATRPVFRAPMKSGPVVLTYVPALAGTLMATLMVQVAPAVMIPLLKVSVAAPAVGAKVGEPQFEVEAAGVGATTIAPGVVGRVSVNPTSLMALLLVFWMVNDRVEVPPVAAGVNAFENAGPMILAVIDALEKLAL